MFRTATEQGRQRDRWKRESGLSRKGNLKKINGAFVPIMKDMISSPAFLNLTNASRVAYLLLKAQCCKFDQKEIKFPYSHAEKYMHMHTFAASLKQLEENGFIEKTQEGGLFRRTNIYSLTDKWKTIK